jgi:hypothetical protein
MAWWKVDRRRDSERGMQRRRWRRPRRYRPPILLYLRPRIRIPGLPSGNTKYSNAGFMGVVSCKHRELRADPGGPAPRLD